MTLAYRSNLKMVCLAALDTATLGMPVRVTTFPGGDKRSDPFEIQTDDHFDLVDVTACASVTVRCGEVEILDASGNSEVTVTGGKVHFLEAFSASKVNILGGQVEHLSVADDAIVRIFGTNLKLHQNRVTGVLADGSSVEIRLAGPSVRSIRLLPASRTSCEPINYGGGSWDNGHWGRAG